MTLPVRVITPHAGIDAFRDALRSIRTSFGPARQLAWRFFLRDTRADHRQSLLGYAWLVVPVLANTLVWVFLNSSRIIRVDSGSVPYPLFVLSGTILWTALNGSLMSMLGVIGSARGALGKVNFPHEALVYTAILKAVVDALIASLLLIPALLLYQIVWHPGMLVFPVAVLGSLVLGAALGLLGLPLAALYPDVGRGVQLVLRFGYFFTPIIFQLPGQGLARSIMLLNPATPVVISGRAWLTGSGEAMPVAFAWVVTVSIVLFAAGLLFYKVAMPHLIERLSG